MKAATAQFVYLALAIVAEVTATTALKASAGMRETLPSVIVVVGYSVSFYFLSLTLRTMSIGIAYAIWSGIGLVLISLAAWWLYGQALDAAAIIGMALIAAGVAVINLFSRSVSH